MNDQQAPSSEGAVEGKEETHIKVQFRAGDLLPDLQPRVGKKNRSINQVAARDLRRYYNILEMALATVTLTREEALLLSEALRNAVSPDYTVFDVAKELPAIVAKRELPVPQKLITKLRELNLLQRMAVIDAVERYRAHHATNDPALPDDELLVRVGLLRLA